MKYIALALVAAFLGLLASRSKGQASTLEKDGPALSSDAREFRPGAVWLDDKGVAINAHGGGILYHDSVYYWFGEHKVAGAIGNTAQVGVHVYASTNLYNWKDEGIALPVSSDPASEITRGCVLERPKVIFNRETHKFVMWFHLELKGKGYLASRCGVAIADQPVGPYRFLYSMRPNAGVWPEHTPPTLRHPLSQKELAALSKLNTYGGPVEGQTFPADSFFRRDFAGGQMSRDMTLFVDDDQKAYQIYSSEENGTIQISELDKDYLKPAGRYARILVGQYNEASALFRHAGKYFLITSGTTGWASNAARLAAADSIFGPWRSLGNPCRGTEEERSKTFDSQSTFVLPVHGKKNAYIFMADRWRPDNAIDGRYIWLPIQWDHGIPYLEWKPSWTLAAFAPLTHTKSSD